MSPVSLEMWTKDIGWQWATTEQLSKSQEPELNEIRIKTVEEESRE